MTVLLAANTLFLALVGVLMFSRPRMFFGDAGDLALALTRGLAGGDLGMAALSAYLLARGPLRDPPAFFALAVFQLCLCAALLVGRKTPFFKAPVLVTHALFGVAFVLALAGVGPLG